MSNVLVTGANGQLGSEIKDLAPNYNQYHFFFTDVYRRQGLEHHKPKGVRCFLLN